MKPGPVQSASSRGYHAMQNHSVIQSSFANPYHLLTGGFFSSFVLTKDSSPSGTRFTAVVDKTKPISFYIGSRRL
jgi:hypothetical protein